MMINKLRGYIVVLCFIIFGIGTIFMAYIAFPTIKLLNKDIDKRLHCYSNFIRISWRIFIRFLELIKVIKLNFINYEKLTNIKNSVIVSTHPSFIDGVILHAFIPNTTCLVANRLSENFITKNIVNSMFIISGLPIDKIIEQTKNMFNHKFNVSIFPSGRRHTAQEFPKIRRGAALMAIETNRDIVPIRMTTNIPFLQIGEPVYKALESTVEYTIEVCDTISISDYMDKYKDSVTQKTELTRIIKKSLYNKL